MSDSPIAKDFQISAHTGVTHFVAFTFLETATQKDVDHVISGMMGLKDLCLDANGNTYIQIYLGGTNNNPAGRNDGITHGFVAQFKSVADRDYYLTKDPVHVHFEGTLSRWVKRAFAFDFTPTQYSTLAAIAAMEKTRDEEDC